MKNAKTILLFIIVIILNQNIVYSKSIQINLTLTDDTFVDGNEAGTNFGSETFLYAGNYSTGITVRTTRTFLKFNLSVINDSRILNASLSIFQSGRTGFFGVLNLSNSTNQSWSESSITFNNHPSFSQKIGIFNTTNDNKLNTYHILEITDYVKGINRSSLSNNLSLAIVSNKEVDGDPSIHRLTFNSKEGTNKPFLNITINNINNPDNVSITPLPLTAGSTAKGHANYSDLDNDVAGGNQTYWYVNKSIIKEANNSFTLGGGNVTESANITFSARFNDTFDWSEWVNSSTATVGDSTPPIIVGQSINGNSFTTNDRINVSLNCSDAIGTIQYSRVEWNRTGSFANDTMNSLDNNVFAIDFPFSVGKFNITNFYCADGSGNIARDLSNFTIVVTSPSSPIPESSSSGGGGGGSGGCTLGFTAHPVTGECVNVTNLTTIILSRNLSLIPTSNIDSFFIFTKFKNDNPEWRYLLKANKIIKNCTTTGNFKCQIFQQSDILLTSLQDKEYFSYVEIGSVKVIDIDSQVSFRSLTIRMINLSYPIPFLPFKGSFIMVTSVVLITSFIYRKKIAIFIKKILKK